MKILSIHYGHNATVGFAENGEVKLLLAEERILRLKNATGYPVKSLEYAGKHYLSGSLNNADLIVLPEATLAGFIGLKKQGFEAKAFTEPYYLTKKKDIRRLCSDSIKKKVKSIFGLGFAKGEKASLSNEETLCAKREFAAYADVDEKKIVLLNHHKAHAYAAGFFGIDAQEKSLIFTLDGIGDGLCATVNVLENGELNTISASKGATSLGYIYRGVTAYLGMKPDEHEFKVMGMAPYAHPKHAERVAAIFRNILSLDENAEFKSTIDLTSFALRAYLLENLVYERFDNISGGVQLFTEEITCEWVRRWIKKTGIRSIALGGGVFMNVKAVKKISELPEVDKILVIPSAGDESLPVGCLYYGSIIGGVKKFKPIRGLYLGREFCDDETEGYFQAENIRSRYDIEKLNEDDMAKKVGKLLADRHIVARCVGREEWGARALGNRSIMANPDDSDTIRILNQKIKSRDFWMPFTPSILDEGFDDYIINPKKIHAPYMCITFDSTEKAQREIPAALHPNDFTARPQKVEKDVNPGYYKIIKEFKNLTGRSGILNTSFNLHGEPNVGGPKDAIHTLDNSGLNYVVIGNFLVSKKDKSK